MVGAGKANLCSTARVDIEQFYRGIAHLFRGLFFGLVPLVAAQSVKRCKSLIAGTETANKVERRHRYIEFGFVGVRQQQKFLGTLIHDQSFKADVTTDAVFDVDYSSARFEFS